MQLPQEVLWRKLDVYVLRLGKRERVRTTFSGRSPRKEITFCARNVARDGIILIGRECHQFGKSCSAPGFPEALCRYPETLRDWRYASCASVNP